ncbi:MAG: sulfatase-like hydrolase/transferase, partial [Planctomycetes bacterium]|nr:sulfatase-like hydrolase/transferase [Planctomycetota bacterium]
AGMVILALRRLRLEVVLARGRLLAIAAGVTGFVLLPLVIATTHLVGSVANRDHSEGKAPKRLVLVVLDGLPTQHIHTYNPEAPRTELDDVLDDGLVFQRMYTARTFTYGFFGTLYSGHELPMYFETTSPANVHPSERFKNANFLVRTFRPPWVTAQPKKTGRETLLGRLQQHGVTARWACFHRGGIPETCSAHTSDYGGLRSYFLTENYTWIPGLLNLNYHVATYHPGTIEAGGVGPAIYQWLNRGHHQESKNVFVDTLLPQIKSLGQSGPSFLVYHISWKQGAIANVYANDNRPATAQGIPGAQRADIYQQLRENEYRYDKNLEWFVQREHDTVREKIKDVGKNLAEFMRQLRADAETRDVTICLMADHGSIYQKGRIWYGFHPNEEVVRVPFALLNSDERGEDTRLFSTVDVTASILDFFNVPKSAQHRGQSIWDKASSRSYVATVTSKADKHKEWFMVLTKDGVRYRSNLHPEGPGTTEVLKVDGYNETVQSTTRGAPDEVRRDFESSLADFGISYAKIHPRFRSTKSANIAERPTNPPEQRKR